MKKLLLLAVLLTVLIAIGLIALVRCGQTPENKVGECDVIFEVDYYLLETNGHSGQVELLRSDRTEIIHKIRSDNSGTHSCLSGGMTRNIIACPGCFMIFNSYDYSIFFSIETVSPDKVKFECYGSLCKEDYSQSAEVKWGEMVTVTKATTQKRPIVLVLVIRPYLSKDFSVKEIEVATTPSASIRGFEVNEEVRSQVLRVLDEMADYRKGDEEWEAGAKKIMDQGKEAIPALILEIANDNIHIGFSASELLIKWTKRPDAPTFTPLAEGTKVDISMDWQQWWKENKDK